MSTEEPYIVDLSRADLERVLAWVIRDGKGVYSSTRFDNLPTSVHVHESRKVAAASHSLPAKRIGGACHYLHQDWWNLLTIIRKLEWMHARTHSDAEAAHLWFYFATADIDMFHVELRSCFDQLARVVAGIARQHGVVPDNSWHDVLSWTRHKARAPSVLGEQLCDLVLRSEPWFGMLRDIRDGIVHRGAQSLAFPTDKGIHFQVLGTQNILAQRRFLMDNENIIDFRLYASYHLALFWILADAISGIAFDTAKLPMIGLDGVRSYHSGLDVLADWSKPLLTRLPA